MRLNSLNCKTAGNMQENYTLPWEEPSSERLVSPDKNWNCALIKVTEINISSHLIADLSISNGMVFRSCGTSFVWSSDSKYLAIPQWTGKFKHKLIIVDLQNKRACYAKGIYNVFAWTTFQDNIIRGVDPTSKESEVNEININKLNWKRKAKEKPNNFGTRKFLFQILIVVIFFLIALIAFIYLTRLLYD